MLTLILLPGSFYEERIIEIDDMTRGTVVDLQRLDVHHLFAMWELTINGVEQAPVA